MGVESLKPASTSTGAVFLSYASQDAAAARKICEALRASAIEVWLDQSELRGGEAWDRKIRRQIQECALFLPIISANAHARDEGYFRLEWKLAVDRSHLMSPDKTFLLPVVIDNTPQTDERIPDRFRELQWASLPDGQVPQAFIERVQRLLSPASTGEPAAVHPVPSSATPSSMATQVRVLASSRLKRALQVAAAVVVLGAVASFAIDELWISKPAASHATPPAAAAGAAAFSPPPHSIAVLPFVNMSGDKDQEYFSEGLTEELLNSLSRIHELQVAARTSSFSFQGEHPDIATVAHKLNVGAVLEGSVRRSGNTVRITTQLVNGVTGFHLWSQTYDRDLRNVLKLQSEIATAVASALKVTLLGDETAKIELGGTRNPAAFDAYLRGRKAYVRENAKSYEDAIAAYTEAIRVDPTYALAFAGRSLVYSQYAVEFATGAAVRKFFDEALRDAHEALALAPDLADAQLALARFFDTTLDFAQATEAYDRARALAPGSAEVLGLSGRFAVYMGRFEAGLTALSRGVTLDPLNPRSHIGLSRALVFSGRYAEAVSAATDAISLDSEAQIAYGLRGLAYYGLGDLERARASCEAKPDFWITQWCLAVTYERLGRHAEADAVLAKYKAERGDDDAHEYATIYAQWGDMPKALEWLETATRLRDPGLVSLKTDPLMDPLRKEPRFQAVMRQLKFPE